MTSPKMYYQVVRVTVSHKLLHKRPFNNSSLFVNYSQNHSRLRLGRGVPTRESLSGILPEVVICLRSSRELISVQCKVIARVPSSVNVLDPTSTTAPFTCQRQPEAGGSWCCHCHSTWSDKALQDCCLVERCKRSDNVVYGSGRWSIRCQGIIG